MQSIRIRSSSLLCILSLLAHLYVVCQELNAQVVQNRQALLTRSDIANLSADSHQRIDWTWLVTALEATPNEDRENLLKLLIASPREELACDSAGYGIRQKVAGLEGIINSRVTHWSLGCQSSIIANISDTRPVSVAIPRTLVQAALTGNQPRQIDSGPIPLDVVGLAALLLENFGSRTDRDLLAKLVIREPESAGAWLAVAEEDAIGPELVPLALATYHDESLNLLVRVAAAAALSPRDIGAARFALSQLKTFLDRLERESISQMLQAVFQPSPAGKDFEEWVYWTKYATILRTLMVLKGKEVEPLVLMNMNSANEHVRTVCAVVAVIRWPEQLMQISQGLFSEREYAGLMAALSLRHPELAARAEMLAIPTQWKQAKEQIAKSGVYGISGSAGMLQPFWK